MRSARYPTLVRKKKILCTFFRSAPKTEVPIADSADVWLTVPAAWDARGCDMMREAAITAGLVRNVGARDRDWRDRLRIITYDFICVPFRIKPHPFVNSVNPRLRQYIART